MDHNQAMDLITSFFDEEVIEGLQAMQTLAEPDDKDIIFDLTQHENSQVRDLAQKVLDNLEGNGSPQALPPVSEKPAGPVKRPNTPILPDDDLPIPAPVLKKDALGPIKRPMPSELPRIPASVDIPAASTRPPALDDLPDVPMEKDSPDMSDPAEQNDSIKMPPFKSPEVNRKKEEANLSKVDSFIQEMAKPVDLPGLEGSQLSSRRVLLPRNRRGAKPGAAKTHIPATSTDTLHVTGPESPDAELKMTPDTSVSSENRENKENLKSPTARPGKISGPAPSKRAAGLTDAPVTTGLPSEPASGANIRAAARQGSAAVSTKHDTPLNGILLDAIERGASDIHLFTGYPPILRIHGDIQFENLMPLPSSIIKDAATSILGDVEYRRFVEEMELDMAYHIEGKARFRVNVFNDINGIAMIFRHIPDIVPSVEQLRLPPVFKEICEERKGLILVTGATGSGKTTTIASMIDWINRHRKAHILTIEDPVEFVHKPKLAKITHRQVRQNTKSFTTALRSALRQDPDVILIGEMRDLDSVSIALHAAETGHLVFGTLHTKSAARTVSRLIGIFPPREQEHIRHQLADGLKGVICQHLFKRSDGQGRIPAFEIMRPNSAIANLIRKSNTSQINDAIRSGKSKGMISMVSSVAGLINSGRIDIDEALPILANEEEKDELKSLLNKKR